MPYFRRKPHPFEARQFTGEPDSAMELWLGAAFESWIPSRRQLAFHSLGNEVIASAGDWIRQGPGGAFSVCKPWLFEQTYEPVED